MPTAGVSSMFPTGRQGLRMNWIQAKTQIAEVADVESTRYALSGVHATPAKHGGVWLAATDSRALAVVKADGELDGRHLVHRSAFPESPQGAAAIRQTADGWQCPPPKAAPQVEGKFPRYHEVLPEVSGRIQVVVDVAYLMKLAKALNKSEEGQTCFPLTLFVGEETPEGQAIGVLGDLGIGALKSMASESSLEVTAALYESMRQQVCEVCAEPAKPSFDPVSLGC